MQKRTSASIRPSTKHAVRNNNWHSTLEENEEHKDKESKEKSITNIESTIKLENERKCNVNATCADALDELIEQHMKETSVKEDCDKTSHS